MYVNLSTKHAWFIIKIPDVILLIHARSVNCFSTSIYEALMLQKRLFDCWGRKNIVGKKNGISVHNTLLLIRGVTSVKFSTASFGLMEGSSCSIGVACISSLSKSFDGPGKGAYIPCSVWSDLLDLWVWIPFASGDPFVCWLAPY